MRGEARELYAVVAANREGAGAAQVTPVCDVHRRSGLVFFAELDSTHRGECHNAQ